MDSIEVGRILIREVEKYPILYDSGRPDAGNKLIKQDAWEDVCKAVITTWEECSIYEKVNAKRDIQKRWQAILQPFVKSLNPNSGGKKPDKQYIYHNELQFIIPILNRPKVVPTISAKNDVNNKTVNNLTRNIATRTVTKSYIQTLQSIRPKPDTSKSKTKRQYSPTSSDIPYKSVCLQDPLQVSSTKIMNLEQGNTLLMNKTLNGTSNVRNQPKIISSVEIIPKMYVQVFQPSDKNIAPQPYEEVLIREDNNSEEDPLQPLEDDPDRMFFLSLLPSFRKIPAENKLLAQLEVMQAIMKYTVPSSSGDVTLLSSTMPKVNPSKASGTKNTTSMKTELNT